MWYFSWILGLGLALAFGVLNAMWYEVTQSPPAPPGTAPRPDPRP
jgi:cyd operon protein YbgT